MTKIVAVGDLHLGRTHLFDVADQERALQQVLGVAEHERARLLLIAGDTFHRNRPSTPELLALGRFFQDCARARGGPVEVVVVPGNHDPEPPAILQHFPGLVHVADGPQIFRTSAGVDVACLPYLPDRFVRARLAGNATRQEIAHELTTLASEILQGFLAARDPLRPFVFLGHGTIAGSETNTGYTMGLVGGTEWRLLLEDLTEFDLAIVGHVHKRQSPAPNVVVPGSLLPLDFSEEGERSVVVGNLLEGYRRYTWGFVPIVAPEILTLAVDSASAIETAIAQMGEHGVLTPARLRIQYRANEDTLKAWPVHALEAAFRERGVERVQVDLEVERAERARDEGMTADLDIARAMDRYLERAEEPARGDRLRARVAEQLTQPFAIGIGAAAPTSLDVTKIYAENFLGLEGANLQPGAAEILALAGPVGIGKSSVGCDVLRFALFGVSRYGARNTALLVREGQRSALAAVELAGAGEQYRIVRKISLDGRGRATTTLDVLQFLHEATHDLDGTPKAPGERPKWWRPISDGKIAAGEHAIAQILGGLTDQVLTVANLVIQREADGWTGRAKPEERKRLLAGAAGLEIYDELADDAARSARAGERARDLEAARLEPIRTRLARIPELEDEVKAFTVQRIEQEVAANDQAHGLEVVRANLGRERDRAVTYTEQMAEARVEAAAVTSLEEQIATWERRRGDAQAAIAGLVPKRRLQDEHRTATLLVAELETSLAGADTNERIRAAARERKLTLEVDLNRRRGERQSRVGLIEAALKSARDQVRRLEASGCPVIERIRTKELAACAFLKDAQREGATIDDLEVRAAGERVPTVEEDALTVEILGISAPAAIDRAAIARRHTAARADMDRLARALEEAGEVRRRAEQTVEEAGPALEDLRGRLGPAQEAATARKRFLVGFGGNPVSAVARLEEDERAGAQALKAARDVLGGTERRLAASEALLADARAGAADLAAGEEVLAGHAAAAEEYAGLVRAWKACRVLVLEASVIPAVEGTANEILRRFPYGLQIALTTQRDKIGGGVSEALDVEVLGGKAAIYEGCSGGQRTTIDVALHVAIALVVSRRSASRLRFLFLDEPEGLDAAGRVALAGIVRWIAEDYSLRVLVASHHEDLVEALGADIVPITGEPGAAIVGGKQ